MKFVHILVVIFGTLLRGASCHWQMHLNAIEYIMACERTQRFELRKEKLEKKSEIAMTKKTKKKIAMKQVRNRHKSRRSVSFVKTILQYYNYLL